MILNQIIPKSVPCCLWWVINTFDFDDIFMRNTNKIKLLAKMYIILNATKWFPTYI